MGNEADGAGAGQHGDAQGHSQREIGLALGCDFKTVAEWQRRWKANAFEGLEKERPGRGRKAWVLPGVCEAVVRMTIEERPDQGIHWSTRTMAEQFGIGPTNHNKNPKPFIWKAEAKDILAKVLRARAALATPDNSRDLH